MMANRLGPTRLGNWKLLSALTWSAFLADHALQAGENSPKRSTNPIPVIEVQVGVADVAQQKAGNSMVGNVRHDGRDLGRASIRGLDDLDERLSAGKPQFALTFQQSGGVEVFGGAKTVQLQGTIREPGQLASVVARELGEMSGLRVPQCGHAILRLNGQNLGLYLWQGMPEAVLAMTAPSNKLAQLEAVLHQPSGGDTLAQLRNLVDIESLKRLLAWEAFVRHDEGYVLLGTNTPMLWNTAGQKFELASSLLPPVLGSPTSMILTEMKGSIASLWIGTAEGRLELVTALASIASDAKLLAHLTNVIRSHVAALEPHVIGLKEDRRLRREVQEIEAWLTSRSMFVAAQVAELAIRPDLATMPLGTRRVYHSAQPLLLGSSTVSTRTVAAFDEALRQPGQTDTNTIPKLYNLSIKARPGLLENLHWSSTNWQDITVECERNAYANVALRLRGHGTRQGFAGKPSLTLKFNEAVRGRTFDGMTKLHLHNAVSDPSYLNAYAGHWLFRKAGLVAPEVSYAHLVVNEKDYGLYVVVEGVTRGFLNRTFNGGGGLLFEGEGQDVDGALDIDSGVVPEGYSDVKRLADSARLAIGQRSFGPAEPWVDLQHFAAFVALELILGHRDGYTLGVNNYRIYQPALGGPFYWIPHGMDWLTPYPRQSLFPEARGLVAKALLSSSGGRQAYRHAMSRILTDCFSSAELTQEFARVSRRIRPVLSASTPLQADRQASSARSLLSQLSENCEQLLQDLQLQSASALSSNSSNRGVFKP